MAMVPAGVIVVEYISSDTPPDTSKLHNSAHYEKWMQVAFTKFHAIRLVQFDRVLFLDADMIVRRNSDHLFKLNAPAGIFSSLKPRKDLFGKLLADSQISRYIHQHPLRG